MKVLILNYVILDGVLKIKKAHKENIFGTYKYMSPELISIRKHSNKVDI